MFEHVPGESLIEDDDDGKNDTWTMFRRDCSVGEVFLYRIIFCEALDEPKPKGAVEIDGRSSKKYKLNISYSYDCLNSVIIIL